MELIHQKEGIIAAHAGQVKIFRENEDEQDAEGDHYAGLRQPGRQSGLWRLIGFPAFVQVVPVPNSDPEKNSDGQQREKCKPGNP